ncbi:DUF551 domain-containing protein [Legionella cardiaca]|uniref:DUF551 domain-containing protein n=1 Tax=Legionella cardiaca TaxID=1071983 RepID=A0ABY8ANF0_9GAMM|nr:DUF551 domain-containing protein [Legionella cardiaca]WED42229.1 DUF551 domain-containing protein [Legionella cardiaca]
MKWNSMKQLKPGKDGQYLTVVANSQIQICNYNKFKDQWKNDIAPLIPVTVTHWMELPSLPKP